MKKVKTANNDEIRRVQATLFIDEPFKESIEKIRRKYNPEQYSLIGCHITLLRDDELTDIENVTKNLSELNEYMLEINFGNLRRSDDGKGVLIEGKGSNHSFHSLREKLLANTGINNISILHPHITLIHPRNGNCTDEIFEKLKKQKLPSKIAFKTVSIIEQLNGGKWNIVNQFNLK
ncbi:MAG: 2'-5' RNA ligase family protein [Bacteroidia bacterium]|uniref:2'-5' RNA ligase family protein n=1 Tax=Flavobacterium solisilvae TaxID=1852019 RepID=A0ABX1QS30_9FLAO|nr:2'-5' RNA ligase family protein [Flavobacterium solisilvae]MBL7888437.1 2'-5' RNA ligase family protein [Bacteroidia bacterium]NMH23835.1 2'-5' RNA ligase family protein [Flavobacterium solisilvae]